MNSERDDSARSTFEMSAMGMSRRRVLLGGGMLFGAALLQACSSKRTRLDLPNPVEPSEHSALAGVLDGWNAPSLPTEPILPAPPPTPPEPALPVGVMPRSAWTRAGVARPRDIYAIGGINRITIHHDGMRPERIMSQGDAASRLEQIRLSHVSGRGWADIGYHYIVDPGGRVWEGRNIRYQGAHVKDQNENNLGVLVLGNFEVQHPTPQQLSSLDRFVAEQMALYRVPMWRVRSHRELAQTQCPGRNLQSYLVRTRAAGGTLSRMAQA